MTQVLQKPFLIVQTGSIASRLPSVVALHGDLDVQFLQTMGLPQERVSIVNVNAGEKLTEPPEAYAGILITGSPSMVSAREPWMAAVAIWLRRAAATRVPMLGVCFGHQLLAYALGGTVGPNPKGPEAGTINIDFTKEATTDPLFSGLPTHANFNAHHYESVLELPPGAKMLASNNMDASQAVRYAEMAWGVQFHPEFSGDFMRALLEELGEGLVAAGRDARGVSEGIVESEYGRPLLHRLLTLSGIVSAPHYSLGLGSDLRESSVVFDRGLGQFVRTGSWDEQCQSTYDMAIDAIRQGRRTEAAQLTRYIEAESREAFELFTEWRLRTRQHLLDSGVDGKTLERDEADIIVEVTKGRQGPIEPGKEWRNIGLLIEYTACLCESAEIETAVASIEAVRSAWLDLHDRLCDWTQGMVGLVARNLGEDQIGALWQMLMASMIDGYERYNIDHTGWKVSAEKLLFITAEALRGHLSGPGRRGTVEFVREQDRVGFRFKPCGSGGRNATGETYGHHAVTTEAHDWAWNLKGVCLYCAHCCVLSEVNPIQRLGYPAREVEPPYDDGQSRREYCTWWIYNDPSLVPEYVYRRTGNSKPLVLGGKAAQHRNFRL